MLRILPIPSAPSPSVPLCPKNPQCFTSQSGKTDTAFPPSNFTKYEFFCDSAEFFPSPFDRLSPSQFIKCFMVGHFPFECSLLCFDRRFHDGFFFFCTHFARIHMPHATGNGCCVFAVDGRMGGPSAGASGRCPAKLRLHHGHTRNVTPLWIS